MTINFTCTLCKIDKEIDEMPEYNPTEECLVCEDCAKILTQFAPNMVKDKKNDNEF